MLATKGPLIEAIRGKRGFICDMDGVIYHGRRILPGVIEFVNWLQATGKPFLFLTNSSEKTPHELSRKLHSMGLQVGESHFYTSALATADFVSSQSPGSSAYVIGDSGLMGALHEAGIVFTDIRPDYVIIGETRTYGYDSIRKAMNLVMGGARLIGTNPDISGPSELGVVPGCGALISPIEIVTGKRAYFIGKPNPLMMRTGLKLLGVQRSECVIIGDRMDTDIVAGIESEIDTVLVLSGVSDIVTVKTFPYRPAIIINGVGEIVTRADGDSGVALE